MGYYTTFEVAVIEGCLDDDIVKILREETSYTFEEDSENSVFADHIKWYTRQDDMLRISRRYPNVVFRVRGNGEESGDVWQTFYKNGKYSDWKLTPQTYPEYDESMLTDD